MLPVNTRSTVALYSQFMSVLCSMVLPILLSSYPFHTLKLEVSFLIVLAVAVAVAIANGHSRHGCSGAGGGGGGGRGLLIAEVYFLLLDGLTGPGKKVKATPLARCMHDMEL